MSDIWSTLPWDLIPDSLKAEETRAFSTAMGNAFHRMLPYTGRVSGHASIDMLPDEILDLLAVELKTQYYREDLPQDTKRELIRQTIPWYMQAGTPSVIREYLGTVFDGGKTEEWFSYGGKPYYFRAYVYAESHEIPLGYGEEVKQQILAYKNVRSWLEYFAWVIQSWYQVCVCYQNAVTLQMTFWPRQNLEVLYLDRTWDLDGSRKLNGYRADHFVDLYPVHGTVLVQIPEPVRYGQTVCFEGMAIGTVRAGAETVVLLESRIPEPVELKTCARIQGKAVQEISVGKLEVMTVNILDGTWKLDGSRKLNGGRTVL